MMVTLQHFKMENKHSAILITRFPVIFIDLKIDVRSQEVVRLWPHLSHRLLRPCHTRILYRTRMVHTIRVWYVPYAYGTILYTIRVRYDHTRMVRTIRI